MVFYQNIAQCLGLLLAAWAVLPRGRRRLWRRTLRAAVLIIGCVAMAWGAVHVDRAKPPKPPRKRVKSVHITVCPIDANLLPPTNAAFLAKLEGGLRAILDTPDAWKPIASTGDAPRKLQSLRVDLSGASLTPQKRFPKSAGRVRDPLDYEVEALRLYANPLLYQGARISATITAQNVGFGLEADAAGKSVLVVNEAWDGRFELDIKQSDIEAMVLASLQAQGKKYRIKVEKAELCMDADSDSSLKVKLRITARPALLKAVVNLSGRVEIDRQLNAKLTGLDCEGEGAVATILVEIIRPLLQDNEGKQISLTGSALEGIQLRDLHLRTDDCLRVSASFGEPSAKP